MFHKKILLASVAMLIAGAAQAQSAGSNVISLGWFRVMPTNSADPLVVDSINGFPVGQT
jgi:outer membrane protein